jgi:copper(I)-binding protein
MRRLLFAVTLLLAAPAVAQHPAIEVQNAWARATPGAVRTGAVYLALTDHGLPDTLIGVSSPLAAQAMVHESSVLNGVARMRMLDKIELAPHQTVTLQPGGMHIMLTGLKQALKAGDSLPLTLVFANAAPMTVSVPVLAAGAAGPATAGEGGHDMTGMKMP